MIEFASALLGRDVHSLVTLTDCERGVLIGHHREQEKVQRQTKLQLTLWGWKLRVLVEVKNKRG